MSRRSCVVVVVGLLALGAPSAAGAHATLGACSPDADLVAFSDALNKTTFDGTAVGGLSALALKSADHARALVDNQGETLVLYGGDRVLIANDNNYPDSNGRIPGLPDDLEADVLDVPGLRP